LIEIDQRPSIPHALVSPNKGCASPECSEKGCAVILVSASLGRTRTDANGREALRRDATRRKWLGIRDDFRNWFVQNAA